MQGKLIVIEGLDGSGKATQAGLLAKRLADAGEKVRLVSFPNYDSPSSALVKMYLGGEFGSSPSEVNAYAASAFYAVDRFAGYHKDWGSFYAEGGTLVADRYATSNFIHQAIKLPQEEWMGFVQWLEDFEYAKMGLPKPGVVVYLDVEPQVSQKLLAQRYAGDEAKKDIHESDLEYLLKCREAALWCTEELGWHKIECSEDEKMRPVEEIAQDVFAYIK